MKTTISSGSKPEIVGSKIVDQTADTPGSQINISIFLGSSHCDRICNAFDWIW